MSASLIEQQRKTKATWLHEFPKPLDRREKQPSNWNRLNSFVSEKEEIAYLGQSIVLIVLLGVTPLVLFLIVYYFHPNLLAIPITPN